MSGTAGGLRGWIQGRRDVPAAASAAAEGVLYRSDHCKAYSLPLSVRHVKGKGSDVNRKEGMHSKLKVKLNRLVRRTHGYSNRLYMPVGSLAMAPLRDGLCQRQRV